jgi:ABC-type Fe3+ transport system substrate-binding protein
VQNYTLYSSALIAAAPNPAAGRAFLAFLATPEAQSIFRESGIVAKEQ